MLLYVLSFPSDNPRSCKQYLKHSSIAVESGNWIVALGIEIGHLLFLQRGSLHWSAYLSWTSTSEGNKVDLMEAPPFCGSDGKLMVNYSLIDLTEMLTTMKTFSSVPCSQTATGVSPDLKTTITSPAEQLDLALPFSWADDIDEWNEDFVELVTNASKKMSRRKKKQEKKRLARTDSRAAKWENLEMTPAAMVSSDLTSVCFVPEMTSTPCSATPLRSEAELRLSIEDLGVESATRANE